MEWLSDVELALKSLGGQVHLSEIYKKVKEIREKRGDTIGKLDAWVRNTLQNHSRGKGKEIFESVYHVYMRKGFWELK